MIWILTAGYGDGHNTAARSVGEALEQLCPGEEVEVCDLLTEAMPRTAAVTKELYQLAITHMPAAWRLVYDIMGRPGVTGPNSTWHAGLVNHLGRRLAEKKPRLIISTYPIYSVLLEALSRRQPVPPLCTVITDSISVNRVWVMSSSDLFCVADDETKKVVAGFGVPAGKIRVPGFPVSLAFTEPLPELPPVSAQRILYLPSTTGRRVEATLNALRPQLLSGVKLTLPVGKHRSRLYHILRRFTDSLPPDRVEIIGWTKRIPEFLRTHDVVICKAGGAILHEVLAAKIPAVIDYIVPGQEEGNAELLTRIDGGIVTNSAGETAAAVESILINSGAVGRRMRTSMAKLSVPDAAVRTAKAALSIAAKLFRACMDSRPPVAVVCAILFKEGRILLAQRPPGKKLAGQWEFAGGKIEPGESAEAALHRELQEELGCSVRLLRELPPVTHDYPWCRVVMTPFICELAPGSAEPHPHEHTELVWVKPEHLRDYDLAPADVPLLSELA